MTDIIRARQSASTGFSLIELMMAVTIVSILAGIAIPSYIKQVRQSRRTEARLALLDLAMREERFMTTNNAYTSVPANLGYSGTFPQVIGSGYYQVSVCVAAGAPCGSSSATTGNLFLAQATPFGSQAADAQCTSFTLDSTGMQAATGTSSSTCWAK
jgi:type IV pilus assembly protein PilE